MAIIDGSGHQGSYIVDNDSDLQTIAGPLVPLNGPDGFPASVSGVPNANYNGQWQVESYVYSKGSGTLFKIQLGSAGPCAAAIAIGTAAGGVVTGSTLLYVVAPPALGLPNTYPLLSAALTAANAAFPGAPATFFVLAGTYAETLPFSLWGGCSVIGATPSGVYSNAVAANTKIVDAVMTNALGVSGAITFSNVFFETSAVSDVWTSLAGSSGIIVFDGCSFSRTIPGSVIGAGGSATNPVQFLKCLFAACYPYSLTNPFYIDSCYIAAPSSSPYLGEGSKIKNTTFTGGFSIGSGLIEDTDVLQGSISYFPPLSPSTLDLVRVGFNEAVGPVVTHGSINPGTVRLTNCTNAGGSAGVGWVDATLTALAFAGEGRYELVVSPAVPFAMSSFADIAVINPAASGVVVTAPDASQDLPGRRVIYKNVSALLFISVVPAPGNTIDGQSALQPVWIAPYDSVELECDRSGSQWRIVSQRGAKNTYSVAKPEHFVSGSFPSFAAAKAQIDFDRLANPALVSPVIDVYPGVYTENLSFSYAVTIRGKGENPRQVVVNGDISLSTLANDHGELSGIRVVGSTVINCGAAGGASYWVHHCEFDSSAIPLSTSFTYAGAIADTVGKIHDCLFYPPADGNGVILNAPFAWDFHSNRVIGEDRLSLSMGSSATNAQIRDNLFEGGVSLLNGAPVLFRRNQVGVNATVGVACGASHIIEDLVFAPILATDFVLSAAGAGQPTLKGYRALAPSAGLSTLPTFARAERGCSAKRVESYAAAGPLAPDVPVSVFTGGVGFAVTLPASGQYPEGTSLYFINLTPGIISLTTTPGDTFAPGGLGVYPIPASSSVLVIVSPHTSEFLIASVT